jgi:hypothetical protein
MLKFKLFVKGFIKMSKLMKKIIIVLLLFSFGVCYAAKPIKLTKSKFKKIGQDNGVVLIQVGWEKDWNCSGYRNAQLQKLIFKRIKPNVNSKSLIFQLKKPTGYSSKNKFESFAYIVKPGDYALVGYDIKVTGYEGEVFKLKSNEEKLIDNGVPIGGTFSVTKNEVVYIGTFGLDCYKQPIPWRYYLEDRENFNGFVKGFKEKYPFMKEVSVVFRLFETTYFGTEFSLPK